MDDLIAFVTARLDEDEAAIADRDEPEDWCDRASGVHMESDRARREIAAKRAILAEYQRVAGSAKAYPNNATITSLGAAQTMLRAIGSVWSDHPDYRAEWA